MWVIWVLDILFMCIYIYIYIYIPGQLVSFLPLKCSGILEGTFLTYLPFGGNSLGGLVAIICPELIPIRDGEVIFVGGKGLTTPKINKKTTSPTKWRLEDTTWIKHLVLWNWCFAKGLLTTIVPSIGPYWKAVQEGYPYNHLNGLRILWQWNFSIIHSCQNDHPSNTLPETNSQFVPWK